MKKFFLVSISLISILIIGGITWFGIRSYYGAEKLQQEFPLKTLVQEVREREDYVSIEQISPYLQEAIVDLEDARFYSHSGVDILGTLRGLVSQFIPFMDKSGGSSITQQTVKNLYGQFNGGASWKGEEIILALKLDQMLSKEEILELYLNIINFGDDYFGVLEASRGYFGILPIQLDLAQASLLAGIPQSPNNFQLSDHFDQAKIKQQVTLNAMVRNNSITQFEAQEAYLAPTTYFNKWQWITQTVAYFNPIEVIPLKRLSLL